MKLIMKNWRRCINELTTYDIDDYKNPSSELNVFKNKLGMIYRNGRTLVLQNERGEGFKVAYKSPNWVVVYNDERHEFKDVPEVVDYLADSRRKADLSTADIPERGEEIR